MIHKEPAKNQSSRIIVSNVQERDRAITAAITSGAPAVRIIKNGKTSWVFSDQTFKALIAQRRAKHK